MDTKININMTKCALQPANYMPEETNGFNLDTSPVSWPNGKHMLEMHGISQ